jgi:hypothetical protein
MPAFCKYAVVEGEKGGVKSTGGAGGGEGKDMPTSPSPLLKKGLVIY